MKGRAVYLYEDGGGLKIMIGISFKKARLVMINNLKKDEDLRRGYLDNISCVIADDNPKLLNKKERDILSDKILKRILI